MPIPRPSPEEVRLACEEFDNDPETKVTESALGQLFRSFPLNTDTGQVVIKALSVNKLYNARVDDIHIGPLAHHIASLADLDDDLGRGKIDAVERIANCPNIKRYYSFATKYCSWHNANAYPLYDGNVAECLRICERDHQFGHFFRDNLTSYPRFILVVELFRRTYGLQSFTPKELDKYLWLRGGELLKEKNLVKTARPAR